MPYKHRKFRQNKHSYSIYLDDRMMWLRLAAAVSLLALGGFVLVGCGDKEADVAPAAGEESPTDHNAGMNTAMVGQNVAPADPSMTMLLPTSPSQYPVVEGGAENGVPAIPVAYRGDWANDVQGCGLPDGIWRFEELKTSTGKGVSCDLTGLKNPAASPSTTLILTCNGEGMTAKEEWELSAPAEGRMNFIRKFEDGGIDGGGTLKLIHCPTTAGLDSRTLHGADRG